MAPDTLYKLVILEKYDEFYNNLKNGYNINETDIHGNTIFFLVIRDNRLDIAEKLIEYSPDVNHQKQNGNTALLVAAARGFDNMCQFLIDHKANINTQNKNGETPLIVSAKEGHLATVKMLLKHGADPTLKNDRDNNIIDVSYDAVRDWMTEYETQHYLMTNFPTLWSSLKKNKILNEKINEEFHYIENATDLNLF